MSAESVRQFCLSLPGVTEHIQWGDHLVFKVGGKSFVITSFNAAGNAMSLKCAPERFAELVERPGIVPAPYLARSKWIALESFDTVRPAERAELLREAYETVRAGLPKKVQAKIAP